MGTGQGKSIYKLKASFRKFFSKTTILIESNKINRDVSVAII